MMLIAFMAGACAILFGAFSVQQETTNYLNTIAPPIAIEASKKN